MYFLSPLLSISLLLSALASLLTVISKSPPSSSDSLLDPILSEPSGPGVTGPVGVVEILNF